MQQPLKPFTLAAYSGVALPMAAMGMPIAVYLPRFYSEGLGLSLITVGLIFTLARVWDVVTDPAMGYLFFTNLSSFISQHNIVLFCIGHFIA